MHTVSSRRFAAATLLLVASCDSAASTARDLGDVLAEDAAVEDDGTSEQDARAAEDAGPESDDSSADARDADLTLSGDAADTDASEADGGAADAGPADADGASPDADTVEPPDGGADAGSAPPGPRISYDETAATLAFSLTASRLQERNTEQGRIVDWFVVMRNDGPVRRCGVHALGRFMDDQGVTVMTLDALADAPRYTTRFPQVPTDGCIEPGASAPGHVSRVVPASVSLDDIENVLVGFSESTFFPATQYTRNTGFEVSGVTTGERAGNPLYSVALRTTVAGFVGERVTVVLYPLDGSGVPLDRIEGSFDFRTMTPTMSAVDTLALAANRRYVATGFTTVLQHANVVMRAAP